MALRNHALLAFGFFFGLRPGEVAAAKRRDIYFAGHDAVRLTVEIDKTNYTVLSTQAPRILLSGGKHLVAVLRRYLAAWPVGLQELGDSAPLFPGLSGAARGSALKVDTVSNIVAGLVPECTGHSMRVGFCTEAIAAGVQPDDLKEFGRWLSDDMIRLYGKRTTDNGVRMAQALMAGGVERQPDGLLYRPRGRV